MAIIVHPLSMATVKAYRGKTDFYFQRGRQVARSWPKKSNLVPTAKQAPIRAAFRAICQNQTKLGPLQRAAWRAWNPPRGQTWVDFVHRVWIGPAQRGTLFAAPDFTRAITCTIPGSSLSALDVGWDQIAFPSVPMFDLIVGPAHEDGRLWSWHILDHKIQRGRFAAPRWAPSPSLAIRVSPTLWAPHAGIASFNLGTDWSSCLFSIVPHYEPDQSSFMCACQRALPGPRP